MLGKIHLVDLAGSEDNRRADNAGQRLKESGAINRSLFTLSQVVEALNRGDTRIPYRDSKLTRLLQDSLGGDSHSCMVANISPCAHHFADSYNCLNFASKSRKIVNHTTTTQRVPVPPPAALHPMRKITAEVPPMRVRAGDTSASLGTTSVSALQSSLVHKTSATSILGNKDAHKVKGKDPKATSMTSSAPAPVPASKLPNTQPISSSTAGVSPRPSSFCESEAQSSSTRDSGVHDTLAAMTPSSKTTFAKACIMKAKLFQKMGRFDEAINMYEEARELFPDSGKLEERIAALKKEMQPTLQQQQQPHSLSKSLGAACGSTEKVDKLEKKAKKSVARRVLAAMNGSAFDDEGAVVTKTKNNNKSNKRAKNMTDEEEENGGADGDGEEGENPNVRGKKKRRSSVADPEWIPREEENGEEEQADDERPTNASAFGRLFGKNGVDSEAVQSGVYVNLHASLGIRLERDLLGLLNTGDMKQLMKINGVGKKRALNVIAFREQERPLEQVCMLRYKWMYTGK